MNYKIDDVCELMKDWRLDIVGVNESKRRGSGGTIKCGSFDTYWSDVDQSQRGCRGIGFILSKRLFECVNRYEYVCLRLLRLRVKSGLAQIFILGVYAPDMPKSLEKWEKFWADVRDILMKCNKNEKIVILGDFNG
ncbi:hypothetical protein EVAR_52926_1 [Eumeta japonica]|uniref:Endonuclease/exonuclease/phosphatase domain-containing protein n=1 Tax=Eumeta variegata TaxID=151549 RepID=A0A4C1Y8B7_EUMVA|nr:hypothetical protein EVAR_52926_1 [Eumeta japonica]